MVAVRMVVNLRFLPLSLQNASDTICFEVMVFPNHGTRRNFSTKQSSRLLKDPVYVIKGQKELSVRWPLPLQCARTTSTCDQMTCNI